MSEHQPASRSAFPSSGRQRAQVSRAVPSSAPAGATLSRPVTVAGGGSIGVAWALVFARGRRQVTLFEPDAGRRRLVPDELQRRLEALAAAGLTDEGPPPLPLAYRSSTTSAPAWHRRATCRNARRKTSK